MLISIKEKSNFDTFLFLIFFIFSGRWMLSTYLNDPGIQWHSGIPCTWFNFLSSFWWFTKVAGSDWIYHSRIHWTLCFWMFAYGSQVQEKHFYQKMSFCWNQNNIEICWFFFYYFIEWKMWKKHFIRTEVGHNTTFYLETLDFIRWVISVLQKLNVLIDLKQLNYFMENFEIWCSSHWTWPGPQNRNPGSQTTVVLNSYWALNS